MRFLLEGPGGIPGIKQARQAFTNLPFYFIGGLFKRNPIVDSNAATLTLTSDQSGAVVLLDRLAGTVVTLPAPVAGMEFTFVVPVSVTSNNYKIITDSGATFLLGQIDVPVAAGTAKVFFADGTTILAVTMNGTTTGGLLGTILKFVALNSTQWLVDGTTEGSGTVATPFATS